MTYRLMPALLIVLAFTLSGCGGGGSVPQPLVGDFFPLTDGTTWTYDLQLRVFMGGDPISFDGTYTRQLLGQEDLTIGGETVTAWVFEHVTAMPAVPDFDFPGVPALNTALNLLFASGGGLQTVRAYYVENPAAAGRPASVELVAISEEGGPIRPVMAPRPYLLTPPYSGAMQQASYWFMPMPLMPPVGTLENLQVHDKLLNFGLIGSLNGNQQAVVDIAYFEAEFAVGGREGAISGRSRAYYQDTIGFTGGLEPADWSATVSMEGRTAQVQSLLTLTSIN